MRIKEPAVPIISKKSKTVQKNDSFLGDYFILNKIEKCDYQNTLATWTLIIILFSLMFKVFKSIFPKN
jgi:hypothetical protein